MIACLLALTLVPLSPPPTVAVPDVLVVDPSGAGDHTTIGAAIEAAMDGDTILIRQGTYGFFVVNNKDLDLVADEGAQVVIDGYSGVANLDSNKEVLFSGIRMTEGAPWAGVAPFVAVDCLGAIRVAGCVIEGKDRFDENLDGGRGAQITRCADIAFFGCMIRGGNAGYDDFCPLTLPGTGLVAVDSTVALHGTTVTGGLSADVQANFPSGGDGGDGCVIEGQSILRAFGSSFRGTNGGDGDASFTFCDCGDGGDGLRLSATSQAEVQGCEFIGGLAGTYFFSGITCAAGDDRSGPIVDLQGTERSLRADRTVDTGGTLTGTVFGEPGDLVFLVISPNPAHYPYSALSGVLHVGSPYTERALPVGQIGGGGSLLIQWPVPPLAAGVLAEHFYVQPIISSSTGRWLASPAAVMVLDPSL